MMFFFQAEDGMRDIGVNGVQTCALPIWPREAEEDSWEMEVRIEKILCTVLHVAYQRQVEETMDTPAEGPEGFYEYLTLDLGRSELLRVGTELRSRWSPDHLKKKNLEYL